MKGTQTSPYISVLEKRNKLLGGQNNEGRNRGTGHDPASLKHRKGEGWIAADVVLNIGI